MTLSIEYLLFLVALLDKLTAWLGDGKNANLVYFLAFMTPIVLLSMVACCCCYRKGYLTAQRRDQVRSTTIIVESPPPSYDIAVSVSIVLSKCQVPFTAIFLDYFANVEG